MSFTPPIHGILLLGSGLIFMLALGLAYFLPLHAGWQGEESLCRFRFAVYVYEKDDYGTTDWHPALSALDATKINKYGSYRFLRRVGGVSSFLGLAPTNIR